MDDKRLRRVLSAVSYDFEITEVEKAAPTNSDSNNQEKFSDILENIQLEAKRREAAKELRTQTQKGVAGATADSEPSDESTQRENAMKRLEAENYLLYSYNRRGAHSLIGKDIRPSSYGGHITAGHYKSKA